MATKSRKRDGKGHVDPFYQRRQRYKTVLDMLELWEAFAAMPRGVQEQFYQHKMPDPIVTIDQSVSPILAKALRLAMEKAIAEAGIDLLDGWLKVRDFYGVIVGCWHLVHATLDPHMPQTVLDFICLTTNVFDALVTDLQTPMSTALYEAVYVAAVAHSRMDGQLITVNYDHQDTAWDKRQTHVVARATESQRRTVTLDGGSRPTYRVPADTAYTGVKWLSWPAEALGRPGDAELAVYAQSHALRQLEQRANLPGMLPYLQTWMSDSLKKPNIVDRQGRDLLIEYRIQDHRLGYLIVTPLADLAVVRTFLFLTMEGTPEARKLKRHLKLTRRDVDWLGLSDLAAFTQTDLRQDPVLRPMLEQCGCGHLFEMDAASYAPTPKPLAADMRRYLRLAA